LTWHAPFVGFPVAQKEIAGRLESGTQRWEDEREWRAKRDGNLQREMMPADSSNPAWRNK
jgi:hypothetical protein